MFVLCPHCEFLVGIDPRTGKPPAVCPKCGKALEVAAQAQDTPAIVDEIATTPAADTTEAPSGSPAVATEAAQPTTPPSQLSADDMIAAMAAKAPRKPRAKPRTEAKDTPKPAPAAAARESTRRKRAEHDMSAPTVAAPVATPTPAPSPARAPTGPSIARRLADWWQARGARSTSGPKPSSTPGEAKPTSDATQEAATRRKASVRPIPSLRDRAAARAAASMEAAAATAALSEIEALSIGDMPEAPLAVPEIPSEAPTTTVEAPAVEALLHEPPAADASLPESPAPATPASDAPSPAQFAALPVALLATARPRTTAAPSFLRARTASPGGTLPASWPRMAAIGGLSLLLVVQLLLAQRDALASDARWRPTIDALCTVVRCAVPAWRQPDAFTMLSRDVRPHARAPGTLQIDASFRNDARWSQPWPRLVVSLSDIDGRVVGTRAFTADEYLGAPPTQNTLAPGQAAAIHLAVVEPAPGIVAFSFEFR